MVEKLFGSGSRVRILQLLLLHPDRTFYIREIARLLDEQMNAVRRELANCEQLGIVVASEKQRKKYYSIVSGHVMTPVLRQMLVTALWCFEPDYIASLKKAGSLQGLFILGFFMANTESPVDVCIIGEVPSEKIKVLVDLWEKQLHTHLRYTMMSKDEYVYRLSVSDRFLHSIIQSPHVELISPREKN